MYDFIHLRTHTRYTPGTGIIQPRELLDSVREQNMRGVAVTDRATLHGALELYVTETKNWHRNRPDFRPIKPIIGCEINVSSGDRLDSDASNHPLLLLCRNNTGYRNLVRLVSHAQLDTPERPRIDRELLARHHDGLIALSGGNKGEVPSLLLAGDTDGAQKAAAFYHGLFDADFYFELFPPKDEQQKRLNRLLVDLSFAFQPKNGGPLPIVATGDCRYLNKEDRRLWEIATSLVKGETAEGKISGEWHLQSPAEMEEIFRTLPDALNNTVSIAERIEVDLSELEWQNPSSFCQPFKDLPEPARIELKSFLAGKPEDTCIRYQERLEKELNYIAQSGSEEDFLVLYTLQEFAQVLNRLPIRGGGIMGGSLIAHLLGFVALDPVAENIPCERFLLKKQGHPYISVEVSEDIFNRVYPILSKRYNPNDFKIDSRVAWGSGFKSIDCEELLRKLGVIMDINPEWVDYVIMFYRKVKEEKETFRDNIFSLRNVLDEYDHFLEPMKVNDLNFADYLKLALRLDPLILQPTRESHPWNENLVVTGNPLVENVPLCLAEDGTLLVQSSHTILRKLGLQQNLKIMENKFLTKAENIIRSSNQEEDPFTFWNSLSLTDNRTLELLLQEEAGSIPELADSGVRAYLQKFHPESFNDLCVFLAVLSNCEKVRGLDKIDFTNMEKLIQAKYAIYERRFICEELSDIFLPTYGELLLDTQVHRLLVDIGGFTNEEALWAWRDLGKKNPEITRPHCDRFCNHAVLKGLTREQAEVLFEIMAYGPFVLSKGYIQLCGEIIWKYLSISGDSRNGSANSS